MIALLINHLHKPDRIIMYRISIIYRNQAGAHFDWEYYMNNHLPLAIGTSRRHSEYNFCDADKPIHDASAHACICMLHFDDEDSVNDFCNFFVKQHPESDKINNDEKNYTNIAPNMIAAAYEALASDEQSSETQYRIKLLFPKAQGLELSHEEISAELTALLDANDAKNAGVVATELDFCTSGIVPGSEPDYSLIWVVCFDDRNNAEQFFATLNRSENLQKLKALLQVEPEIMLSEVMSFDMTLAEPYRLL